jgi:hypothetical protein
LSLPFRFFNQNIIITTTTTIMWWWWWVCMKYLGWTKLDTWKAK